MGRGDVGVFEQVKGGDHASGTEHSRYRLHLNAVNRKNAWKSELFDRSCRTAALTSSSGPFMTAGLAEELDIGFEAEFRVMSGASITGRIAD